ncbi:hypothetical protein, partial [Lentzea pudingi]|uniref:hypothetical protein n=1 Tax=Lentzea pudingi TaxID=1789439 RepID=UPI001E612607
MSLIRTGSSRSFGAQRLSIVVTLVVVAATLLAASPQVSAAPATPQFGPGIDPYAAYQGQNTCDPTAKPGVVEFRDLLNQTYGAHTTGISRACDIGGASEHKEGRALDYHFNVNNGEDRAEADDVLGWLLATDRYGNQHAMARRLGIQYIIWNRQWFRLYRASEGWRPYSGASPHTDHIHFSFSWAGARKQTSWWTGRTGSSRMFGGSPTDFTGDGRDDIV